MNGRAGVRVLAVAIALAMSAAGAAGARAAPSPIAEVGAATPLSGGGGWLVWSVQVPGGWALMGYHAGAVHRLSAALRPQPFDASVGSDRSGAPVVVFSRCARTPEMGNTGGESAGGVLVAPLTGAGCRIHLLPLRGRAERALPIPASSRVSDTTPSIWRGVVTFGRHAPAHGKVMQVMSWSPRAPRRLRTLAHGVVPPCPASERSCVEPPPEGQVTALASDGTIVAFDWTVFGGRVGIEGDQELRIDRVDGRGATIGDGDTGSEACVGAAAGEHRLERVTFEPPFVSARTASFGELYDFGCFTGFAGVLVTHGAAPGFDSRGKLEGVALAVARDEGKLYGLTASPAEASAPASWTGTDGPYCSSTFPCAIEPLAMPALTRDTQLPFQPLSFYG